MPLRVDLSLPRREPSEVIDPSISSLWRYSQVLPVDIGDAVTLGEGWTPLLEVEDQVWVKDEAQNPTGSFKSRGMALAVSAAIQLGAQRLVAPSAGNAASALAAYGARAGIPVGVAMPDDTPAHFVNECRHYGAQVELVPGTISDAGAFLAANRGPNDFDVSTLKEPYRVEGKKTMGYELFEQFDGDLPDVVLYPTGGGTGLVGMWKAWNEMEEMGWIGADRPRLVSVQTAGLCSDREGIRRRSRAHRDVGERVNHRVGLARPRPDRWLHLLAGHPRDRRDGHCDSGGGAARTDVRSRRHVGHRCLPGRWGSVGGLPSAPRPRLDRP